MAEIPEPFVHYLAAWNEADPTARRALLDRSCDPSVVFSDPVNRTEGIAELDTLISETQRDIPESSFRLVSAIDGGHDRRYRYRWEVWSGEAPVVSGMDFTTLTAAGLIERVDGFFGDFPPLDPPV